MSVLLLVKRQCRAEVSGYRTQPGKNKRFGIREEAEEGKRKRDSRRNEYEKKIEVERLRMQDDKTKSARAGTSPDYRKLCTLLNLKVVGTPEKGYRWSQAKVSRRFEKCCSLKFARYGGWERPGIT